MHISKLSLLLFLNLAISLPAIGAGVKQSSAYLEYIELYAPLACEQEQVWKIPASITLAQGLLESGAGRSTLASQGNNHFGIKCHKSWQGETMLRSDDAPDECFRVYHSVEQSFDDHSRFLQGKRYSELFDLDPADYQGWAHGLKQCGYATDPNYAVRLISIIELYDLTRFDAHRLLPGAADYILQSLDDGHRIMRYRELYYVIALPGDTYSSIAVEFGMDIDEILAFNDAEEDGEIKDWEEVYLQPKHDYGPENPARATIGEDESLHSVAQRFGITERALRKFNPGCEDLPGESLLLQSPSGSGK